MRKHECRFGPQTLLALFRSLWQHHALAGAVLFALLTLTPGSPSTARAAVMPFPDADISTTQPIGLDPAPNNGLPDISSSTNGGDGLAMPNALGDATKSSDANGDSTKKILDGVLGIDKKDTWVDQTRDAELTGDVTALDLMRAYVNVIHSGSAGRNPEGAGPSTDNGQGKGFLMSLAEGLDDPRALSLVTKVIQPYVENDMVNFSILGFGRFMLVDDGNSGELSIINLNNGKRMNLRSTMEPGDRMSAYSPNAGPSAMDQAPLFPHEGEALGRLLLLVTSLLANPIAMISLSCFFGAWLLYKVAKRFT